MNILGGWGKLLSLALCWVKLLKEDQSHTTYSMFTYVKNLAKEDLVMHYFA